MVDEARNSGRWSAFAVSAVVTIAAISAFTSLSSAGLEACRNCFGLRATTTRTTATPALVFAACRRFHAAIRAVRALFAFLFLRTHWSFPPRFCDRVGDRARDQIDGADFVIVAGGRNADEIRIGVRIADGDDRDAELVRFADADALLLRIDHEHEAREARHILD